MTGLMLSEQQRFWQIIFTAVIKDEQGRNEHEMVQSACEIADEAVKELEKRFPPEAAP